MPDRELPARPDLDHLKREAKGLHRDFVTGDPAAVARVHAVLGERAELKLTEAQRVIAREHGFRTWSELRTRVEAARGTAAAIDTFLQAVQNGYRPGALEALRARPDLGARSLHVAAALGLEHQVRRFAATDAASVREPAGHPHPAEPLLWLCLSPFHGESPERDAGLLASARALLEAGADPNAKDGRYGVSALYGVTGMNNNPTIARLLLEAGAAVNDGESAFHAAERYHIEALELLREFGVDLNARGDWGNTPLYFLLRYWDVAHNPNVEKGMRWLLTHGADPNVLCDREARESALHVAARRGQAPDVVRLLLEHGGDVNAEDGRGRTPWLLARRSGSDDLVALLEEHGAEPEPLSDADLLLEACGRGDRTEAERLGGRIMVAALDASDLRRITDAASIGRFDVVLACLSAGFPPDTSDSNGATALHFAAIHGHAAAARELLEHGADHTIRDREHHSTPMGWACFGADFVKDEDGDYAATVRALLEGGAEVRTKEHRAEDQGVRAVLASFASGAT